MKSPVPQPTAVIAPHIAGSIFPLFCNLPPLARHGVAAYHVGSIGEKAGCGNRMVDDTENVVRLDSAQEALKQHFLGWQCRIRQHAVRKGAGRPSAGMRPAVSIEGGAGPLTDIIVLIREEDPYDTTAKFRHMVRKTHDPKERLDGAIKELSAAYFQHPGDFSDEITALFAPGSELATKLADARHCILDFDQYSQRYSIPCAVRTLTEREPGWQATFWHNSLFNPNIPGDAIILAFTPDWAAAKADPPVA